MDIGNTRPGTAPSGQSATGGDPPVSAAEAAAAMTRNESPGTMPVRRIGTTSFGRSALRRQPPEGFRLGRRLVVVKRHQRFHQAVVGARADSEQQPVVVSLG